MNVIGLLALGITAAVLSAAGVGMIRGYATQRIEVPYPADHTPRGGGLVILTVVLCLFMPIGFSVGDPGQVVRVALSGALIAMIGFFDDFRTLPRYVRIFAQSLAALVFLPSAMLTTIVLPRIEIPLSPEAGYILGLFWLVGLSNVYSYMDGINGLSSGQAVLAGSLWAGIGVATNQSLVMLLGILIAGASLGFMSYNLPPSNIFLGDVGSTFLGFTLAALPLLAISQGESPRLLITGGLSVSLFVFDATITFLRYWITGRDRRGDRRSHLYQRLVQLGDPPTRVTMLYLVLSSVLGIAGVVYWRETTPVALILCGLACLALYLWTTRREALDRRDSVASD